MTKLQTELELIENFKKLVRSGMSYAEHAHDFLFDESMDNAIALSYLNIAASKFSAAESLYYARYEDLHRKDAEKLFHLFDVFMAELLVNARTHHSHRWTDIEFVRLKEAYTYSSFGN